MTNDTIRAAALRTFADDLEATSQGINQTVTPEASQDYWRGAADATEYVLARLRSAADFLLDGHDSDVL